MIRTTYLNRLSFIDYLDTHKTRDILVSFDLETNSSVDLRSKGLGPYSEDPDLQILMVGASVYSSKGSGTLYKTYFDLVTGTQEEKESADRFFQILSYISTSPYGRVCAHNSQFEWEILRKKYPSLLFSKFIDTATYSRILGASSALEWASRQLTNTTKLDVGKEFIDTFCKGKPITVDEKTVLRNQTVWDNGLVYVMQDAVACLELALTYDRFSDNTSRRETNYGVITQSMNSEGWKVDTVLLDKMIARYEHQSAELEAAWRNTWQPMNSKGQPLNLNSPIQVKEYLDRLNFPVKSTDKVAMAKLRKRVITRMNSRDADSAREVMGLIMVKEALGGAALAKLATIKEQLCSDDRLRHQYVHCGAGQTRRTSGVGVQMQNLKRLNGLPTPNILTAVEHMTIPEMASNMRQLFVARDENHSLLVCDLSSVEARILAWLAGEMWKLEAIRNGKDLYKMLACTIESLIYEQITGSMRADGKVGELGGGYGMGAAALKSYAEKMGRDMTLERAQEIVQAYRVQNPKIKQLWFSLNIAMITALTTNETTDVELPYVTVRFSVKEEVEPLASIMPGCKTLFMSLLKQDKTTWFTRSWRGCYTKQGSFGTEVVYHKPPKAPSDARLWVDHSIDPDTKQKYMNKLYGGKLTGVLVQSFARELFFEMLQQLYSRLPLTCEIIGQFHDEVVIDVPNALLDDDSIPKLVTDIMSTSEFEDLPVACEAKWDYRYIK